MNTLLRRTLIVGTSLAIGFAASEGFRWYNNPRVMGEDIVATRVQARTMKEMIAPTAVAGSSFSAHQSALVGEYLDKACPTGPITSPEVYVGEAAYLSRQTLQEGLGEQALAYAQQCRPRSYMPPPPKIPLVNPHKIPRPDGTTR